MDDIVSSTSILIPSNSIMVNDNILIYIRDIPT